MEETFYYEKLNIEESYEQGLITETEYYEQITEIEQEEENYYNSDW